MAGIQIFSIDQRSKHALTCTHKFQFCGKIVARLRIVLSASGHGYRIWFLAYIQKCLTLLEIFRAMAGK